MKPPPPPPPLPSQAPPAPPPPSSWEPSIPPLLDASLSLPSPLTAKAPIEFSGAEPPDFIRHLINHDEAKFEIQVLAVLLRAPAFVEQVAPVLCVDPCRERTRYPVQDRWNDFSSDALGTLYECIRKNNETAISKDDCLNRNIAETILKQLAAQPYPPVASYEFPGVLAAFDEALSYDLAEAARTVRSGFIYWLRKRRMTCVIVKGSAVADWSPQGMAEKLKIHDKVIDQLLATTERAFVAFDQITQAAKVDLIPSGLRACDDSLDGGFGKGEFSLVIAPSGGGKTTFACQLAATFGLRGYKVLLITTEQPPAELQPRIVSNVCGIPFNRVRGGIDQNTFSSKEKDLFRKICGSLGVNLHFADWSKDRSRSIQTDLRAEVERFTVKHERVDVVIFDWIGGALGTGFGRDQHALRLAYQETGEALGAIARVLGIVVIGFGQAAIGSTRGKKRIDQDDIAECKSLGRSATNVIGISAVRDDTEEDGSSYSSIQYLHVSKARKSAGGFRRFRRQFEFQRLADI